MERDGDEANGVGRLILTTLALFFLLGVLGYVLVTPRCQPINWSRSPLGLVFVEIPPDACLWRAPVVGNLTYLLNQQEEQRKQLAWLMQNYLRLQADLHTWQRRLRDLQSHNPPRRSHDRAH